MKINKKFKNGMIDMLVIVILVVAGVSAAGFYYVNVKNNSEPEIIYVETTKKVYTLEEVSEHDEETDCWMAIDGKVYDVTEYIASGDHPGGQGLVRGCGIDASDLFTGPHSEAAYQMLPEFEIGLLQ